MPRVNSLVSTAGNDTHRLELRVNISLRIYAKIFSSLNQTYVLIYSAHDKLANSKESSRVDKNS